MFAESYDTGFVGVAFTAERSRGVVQTLFTLFMGRQGSLDPIGLLRKCTIERAFV